jgi:hypothetical protein
MSSFKDIKIDALTEDNYVGWVEDAEMQLQIADVWAAIQPDEIPATPNQEMKAKAYLRAMMCPRLRPLIKDCATARKIWDKLADTFGSNGFAGKVALLQRFRALELGEKKMSEYQAEVEALRDALYAAGEIISETMFSLAAIEGLPESYETWKIMLRRGEKKLVKRVKKTSYAEGEEQTDEVEYVEQTSLTLNEVFGVLRQAELSMGKQPSIPAFGMSAYPAPTRKGASKNVPTEGLEPLTDGRFGELMFHRLCLNCEQPGHLSRDCSAPRRKRAPGANTEHARARAAFCAGWDEHVEEYGPFAPNFEHLGLGSDS